MDHTITRRDRREQERQRRQRRPHTPNPRRSPIPTGMLVGGVLVFAVLAIGFVAYQSGVFAPGRAPVTLDQAKYALVAGEVVGQQLPNEGNGHAPAGQTVTYGTNPPTSGAHWGTPGGPVAWGVKETQLPAEAVVHNLEHGGIVIWYRALNGDETRQLTDLVRILRTNGFNKIIVMPWAPLTEARIAVSAWRWHLKLQGYDDVGIVKFVKSHYDGPDAPERGVP